MLRILWSVSYDNEPKLVQCSETCTQTLLKFPQLAIRSNLHTILDAKDPMRANKH